MSSDHRRLNLCGLRQPEEAGLDRLGSASFSRGLIFGSQDAWDSLRLPGTNETDLLSHA